MIKKLFLHIGSHKTGTSAIQRFLRINNNLLNDKSISYFKPDPWPIPFKKEIGPVVDLDLSGFEALKNIESNTVVLSHENYSWITSEGDLKLLANTLSKFAEEVKIILYIRRQDSLAISQKQEGTKWFDNSIAYGHEPSAFPSTLTKYASDYLNFYEKVNKWENAFGRENMIVRIFSTETLINGDAVEDFCNIIGIKDLSSYNQVGRVNESIYLNQQLFLHLTRPYFPENSYKKDILVKSALKFSLDNKEKLMPSRKEAEKFYNPFKDSNYRLNKKYHLSANKYIFSDDFSMYPYQSNSKELSSKYVSSIFSLVIDDILDTSIDRNKVAFLLRDLAIEFEEENINHSLILMKKAEEFKPDGTLIKRKIKEYMKIIGE